MRQCKTSLLIANANDPVCGQGEEEPLLLVTPSASEATAPPRAIVIITGAQAVRGLGEAQEGMGLLSQD